MVDQWCLRAESGADSVLASLAMELNRQEKGTTSFLLLVRAAVLNRAGGSVNLSAVGITVSVDEVYDDIAAVGGPTRDARLPRDPTQVAAAVER